mgnify:CR=1 FL=1
MAELVVNYRIDVLVSVIDHEARSLMLTNGEMVALATLLFAGALKESLSTEMLTLALGVVLYHVNDNAPDKERETWAALLRACLIHE